MRSGRATILAMKRVLPLFLLGASWLPAARNLEVYFIDVEGGQATLVVGPSGESMLVDTGYGGNNRRDAERIAAAAKNAGVKKIDYLVITHYHTDHVGGVLQLSEKLPIRNFVDHGPLTETSPDLQILFKMYAEVRAKGSHILAKPGDKIPVKDLGVDVLSSAGDVLVPPLQGAGQPNPSCSGFRKQADEKNEN